MSQLDVVLFDFSSDEQEEGEFGVKLRSSNKIIEGVEKLKSVWPTVMKGLISIAESTKEKSGSDSSIQFESIEFNIGIETGFRIGLTGTANAGVTVTFTRRS